MVWCRVEGEMGEREEKVRYEVLVVRRKKEREKEEFLLSCSLG